MYVYIHNNVKNGFKSKKMQTNEFTYIDNFFNFNKFNFFLFNN